VKRLSRFAELEALPARKNFYTASPRNSLIDCRRVLRCESPRGIWDKNSQRDVTMTETTTFVPPSPSANTPSEWLDAITALAQGEGDIARMRRGWLFSHPDAIRDVLVTRDRSFVKSPALRRARFTLGNGLLTNEGPTYRRQRGLIQPSLHPKSLGGYAAVMARHAADTAEGWEDGQIIDLHRDMMRLTLRIVGEALFSTPIGPEVDDISQAMDANVGMFQRLTSPWGWLKVLAPTPFTLRFLLARRRLVNTLRRFIAARRASKESHDDLLSRLVKARDADSGGMSESLLIDECVTLFAAGHETTANALTFALWLLGQHPDVMERVQDEICRVVPADRPPTIGDLDDLPYLRMTLAESMRLYPPAWIIGRQAIEPCEVNGRTLKRGEVVFVCQWVTHRDPRWWPEPNRFDPERFSPEQSAGRHRWSYFPFGGGSRLCVGESFAWAEAMLVLATILRTWRMEWADSGAMPLDPGITLRPGREIRMRLRSWSGVSHV
jgi:cytochrome P450